MRSIAIFGGTFDPVHNGHIQTSITIQSQFHFDQFYFLPCKIPIIKPAAQANSDHRIAMLQLAAPLVPNAQIDLREITRDTPSYMVETLQSFRQEYPNAALTLIIGYDALLSLPEWYQWEKILGLANLLVINRQQFAAEPVPEVIHTLLTQHLKDSQQDLLQSLAGKIVLFDAGNYPISSTEIRQLLSEGKKVDHKLPKAVMNYIREWGLFQ
ncbi:MAG: nicotinate-nucleotide adenylyltransferase [Legionella sp.]|nr:MAG: nicotinate-nucleotide adenylyltransferase [Legionella sp.]